MPRIADACSSCGLDTEKCGRRCSSTDASTWQDGLVAILRNALCKDTGRKYRPLFSLLLFSLAKSLTRLEELRDERNLRPKIGSRPPPNCPLAAPQATAMYLIRYTRGPPRCSSTRTRTSRSRMRSSGSRAGRELTARGQGVRVGRAPCVSQFCERKVDPSPGPGP